MGSERVIKVRELDPNSTRADDDHRFRNFGQDHRLHVRYDLLTVDLHVRERSGPGARRDDDRLGGY